MKLKNIFESILGAGAEAEQGENIISIAIASECLGILEIETKTLNNPEIDTLVAQLAAELDAEISRRMLQAVES